MSGDRRVTSLPRLKGQLTIDRPQPGSLRIAGEIDLANVELLRHELDGSITRGGTVRVDLTGVEFLDSAGYEILRDAALSLADHGGRMIIDSPSPQVRRLLALTGSLEQFGLTPA